MTPSLNKVQLIGRLGKDPDVRATTSGKAVANLSIATSSYYNGEEHTEWHRVVLWGRAAEIAGEYVTKGQMIYVEGRLQTREREDKGGQTRRTTEVVGAMLLMLSPKDEPTPVRPPDVFEPPAALPAKFTPDKSLDPIEDDELPF